MDKDYLDQIEIYPINTGNITEINWFLVIVGAVLTLLCVAALCYWLFKLIVHFYGVLHGKVPLGDKSFWLRMTVSLFLLIVLMSGLWVSIMDQMYEQLILIVKEWRS